MTAIHNNWIKQLFVKNYPSCRLSSKPHQQTAIVSRYISSHSTSEKYDALSPEGVNMTKKYTSLRCRQNKIHAIRSEVASITKRWIGSNHVHKDAPTINFFFRNMQDSEQVTVKARVGETILQVAQRYDIELEGACEGELFTLTIS